MDLHKQTAATRPPLTAPTIASAGKVREGGSHREGRGAHREDANVECQPHPAAPLLRDERGRREWVERELEACCQAFDLQKVLEVRGDWVEIRLLACLWRLTC